MGRVLICSVECNVGLYCWTCVLNTLWGWYWFSFYCWMQCLAPIVWHACFEYTVGLVLMFILLLNGWFFWIQWPAITGGLHLPRQTHWTISLHVWHEIVPHLRRLPGWSGGSWFFLFRFSSEWPTMVGGLHCAFFLFFFFFSHWPTYPPCPLFTNTFY